MSGNHHLYLNPIHGGEEESHLVGCFNSEDEMKAFYNAELVMPYKETDRDVMTGDPKVYTKFFRKGGPLENYNPIEEWLTGDLRTLGGEIDENRNVAPNPLNFGNTAWRPELTLTVPITRVRQFPTCSVEEPPTCRLVLPSKQRL